MYDVWEMQRFVLLMSMQVNGASVIQNNFFIILWILETAI